MIYKSAKREVEEVAHFVGGEIVCLEKRRLEDAKPYEIITYSLLNPKIIVEMVTYDRERNIYVPADAAAISKSEEELKRVGSLFDSMLIKEKKRE